MDRANFYLAAALITACTTVSVFLLTRLADWGSAARQRRRLKRRFVIALHAEIDFNTTDMAIFVRDSPPMALVERRIMRDRKLVPHVTDARHTHIYRAGMADISVVDKGLIGQIVHFYGLLDKLSAQVDGLAKPSFGLISAKGRVAAVREVYDTAAECAEVGKRVLTGLEKKYPVYRLKRIPRDR